MNHSKTIYVFDHFSEEKANGSCPKEDLLELWKRIVFSMAISNTDDHLRNHAFLLENNGWRLSPLYDVNPVPYGDELSLHVSEADKRISFALAICLSRRALVTRHSNQLLPRLLYLAL